VVAAERAAAAVELLSAQGETARIIGAVRSGARGVYIRE
jgi:phosphoribosylaminoimidazole (AIR) synthetase